MGCCTVFGTTIVTVSECFMKSIPESLGKEEYFKNYLKDLKYTMIQDGNHESCSLEGPWETLSEIEHVLRAKLKEWTSPKSEDIILKNVCCHRSDCLKTPTTQQDEGKGQMKETVGANVLDTLMVESNDLDSCTFDQCSESSLHAESNHGQQESTLSRQIKEKSGNQEVLLNDEALKCIEKETHSLQEINVSDSDRVPAENEVYMDIQLEHNYNHLISEENVHLKSNIDEPMVENEIYMDIKLSKTNNESFSNPDLPVMLVVSKEDEPGIEVLQLNVNKANEQVPPRKENEGTVSTSQAAESKVRRKKYEEEAPFKYFCSQCSFRTKRNSHMRNHSRFHERICTIYSCDQCDFSTIRASHLQRHIGTHKPELFACSECTYSTHSEALLNRHQRRKHKSNEFNEPKNTDSYQCLQCDYMTTSEKIFQRHLTVHAEKKKGKMKATCFKCKQCSYQTPSRSNFYRHLGNVHGDERPHMCTTCGLRFKRSDTLAQHQSTHAKSEELGRNAFQCPKCEKCYRSANALEEHKLTHEDERRYLCEVCGSSFKTRAGQRKHFIETHVHTKVNACQTCSKTFTTKYLLKRHMKVHSIKQKEKDSSVQASSTSQEVIPNTMAPMDWCGSIVPSQQSSSDVQVFVVHQDPSQSDQEITMQEGQLFRVSPSLVAGQTLPASVLPVEYVISEDNPEDGEAGNSGQAQIPSCDGDIITLAFVQEG